MGPPIEMISAAAAIARRAATAALRLANEAASLAWGPDDVEGDDSSAPRTAEVAAASSGGPPPLRPLFKQPKAAATAGAQEPQAAAPTSASFVSFEVLYGHSVASKRSRSSGEGGVGHRKATSWAVLPATDLTPELAAQSLAALLASSPALLGARSASASKRSASDAVMEEEEDGGGGSSARAAKRPRLGRDAADDSTTLEGAGLDNRTSSFVRPAAGDATPASYPEAFYVVAQMQALGVLDEAEARSLRFLLLRAKRPAADAIFAAVAHFRPPAGATLAVAGAGGDGDVGAGAGAGAGAAPKVDPTDAQLKARLLQLRDRNVHDLNPPSVAV